MSLALVNLDFMEHLVNHNVLIATNKILRVVMMQIHVTVSPSIMEHIVTQVALNVQPITA